MAEEYREIHEKSGSGGGVAGVGGDDVLLLPVLCQTFPWIESYELLETVVQSNANGYIVKLKGGDAPVACDDDENDDDNDDDDDDAAIAVAVIPRPRLVFCKRVIAADYMSKRKDWNDLRRTLCYARTESRFYANFAPILAQRGFADKNMRPPIVYHASYELSDWIREDEPADAAIDDSSFGTTTIVDKDTLPNAQDKGGLLLLEYISQEDYFQDSPLTIEECRLALKAVARLHAAAWQDVELLTRAQRELSMASFHLATRNPKELAGIVEAWEQSFLPAFESDLVEAGLHDKASIRDLGKRLFRLALYVSQQLSPQPTDAHATIIHGDYKALNVFLPKHTNNNSSSNKNNNRHDDDNDSNNNDNDDDDQKAVVMVDFASTGVGLGMSDVAMHIHHCIIPAQLDGGGEEALARYYWEALQAALAERHGRQDAGKKKQQQQQHYDYYPWETAWRHYKLAVVDYGRFFVGRFWSSATPSNMAARKDNKNVNLINRWPSAAMAFIQRLDTYLAEVEDEYEKTMIPPRLKR